MAGAMMPFFSVVIPVYNRARSLSEALASIREQTFQDFEIVVVDDGSSDDPQSAIDQVADPRIRLIRQENKGGGAARNTGIDAARGRFIAFLDSDDRFLPHHLETMHRLLDGTKDTVGYARVLVNRGDGRAILKPPRALRPGEHMAEYLMCDRGFVPTTTLVVESATATRIRFNENLRPSEDTGFAIRLYLAGCRFAMAEEPGAVWNDLSDPARLSSGREGADQLAAWLDQMKPLIPARAYDGCRGWHYAKYVAASDKFLALKLYATAVARGCYRPGLSAIIFLQIFLPDRLYRAIADGAIAWLRVGLQPKGAARAESSVKSRKVRAA
jgi:glycosyltransferase involved in cell wall biosynthesis